MKFNDAILAGVVLNREAIQSDNFVHLTSGWQITKLGSAEFSNMLLYGGIPGNAIIIVGPFTGPQVRIGVSADGTVGGITFPTNSATEGSFGQIRAANGNKGLPNEYSTLQIASGSTIATGTTSSIQLNSANADGSSIANIATLIDGTFTFSTNKTEFRIRVPLQVEQNTNFSGTISANNVDLGKGLVDSAKSVANIGVSTGTDTVLLSTPNITFKTGRAYSVKFVGLMQGTVVPAYTVYKVVKGTTTAGTVIRDQIRIPLDGTAGSNTFNQFEINASNGTGSDITTAISILGSINTGVGILAASATSPAYITVTDIGLASAWPASPIT